MATYVLPSGAIYDSGSNSIVGSTSPNTYSTGGGTSGNVNPVANYSGGGGGGGSTTTTTTTPTTTSNYVNINGAYYVDTDDGLSAVSDPSTLSGLISGTISSTPQDLNYLISSGATNYTTGAGGTPDPYVSPSTIDINAVNASGQPIYTPEQQAVLTSALNQMSIASASTTPTSTSYTPTYEPTYVPPGGSADTYTSPDTSGEGGGTTTPADATDVNNFTGLGAPSGMGGVGTTGGGGAGIGAPAPTGGAAKTATAFDQGAQLTPEQIEQYFATQSTAQNPLSPAEFLSSLSGGPTPQADAVQGVIDAQNAANQKAKDDANKGLEDLGVTQDEPTGSESPYTMEQDIYQKILDQYGVAEIDQMVEEYLNEIKEINDEFAEDITSVNENPWMSEAARSRKVQSLENKRDLKLAGRQSTLQGLQAKAESLRADAKWRAGAYVNAYFQDRQLSLDEQKFAFARAEALLEASKGGDLKFISGTANQPSGVFDPNTGIFTPLGGGPSTPPTYDSSTINGQLYSISENLKSKFSSKFQLEQYTNRINQLMQQGDTQQLADYVFSTAIETIADSYSRKKAMSQYRITKKLDLLEAQLTAYKAANGDTGVFKGTLENMYANVGRVHDGQLARIGIMIADTLDGLARDRTGAVLSATEEDFYKQLLPGTNKKAELNQAIINGLRGSQLADLNNALRFQLTGTGFDTIEPYLGGDRFVVPEIDDSAFNEEVADLEFSDDEDEYNFWESLGNMYNSLWR